MSFNCPKYDKTENQELDNEKTKRKILVRYETKKSKSKKKEIISIFGKWKSRYIS